MIGQGRAQIVEPGEQRLHPLRFRPLEGKTAQQQQGAAVAMAPDRLWSPLGGGETADQDGGARGGKGFNQRLLRWLATSLQAAQPPGRLPQDPAKTLDSPR